MTHFEEGRPLFVRSAENKFNLANFMRTHLYTCLGAMKIGLDILFQKEDVKLDKILGHGGLFKTKGVGQRFLAAAVNAPVSVMETAGEGGAWGIALLAAYMADKTGESLGEYLDRRVFADEVIPRMVRSTPPMRSSSVRFRVPPASARRRALVTFFNPPKDGAPKRAIIT